ncbi:hypothetical protein SAMN02745174_01445 [Cetobacterium ceti]|uniref:Uncharacterized protein n=1 Tax=Cetobacterium ceti TaxID=180163 RepID=A0A1T4N7L5_9FUSO|nr:hypothetical protein [Cetobacterium ceti]SJZ75037.1 hypothetical protein SAMN02745174_01445 [Cetobacterium ceti]
MGEDIFEIMEILNSKNKIKEQYEKITKVQIDFEEKIKKIKNSEKEYFRFIEEETSKKKVSIIFKILFIKRFCDNFHGKFMEKLLELKSLENLKTVINFAQLGFKFTSEEIILFCQLLRNENLVTLFKETVSEIAEENEELQEELIGKIKTIKKLEIKLNFLKNTDNLYKTGHNLV